MSKKPDLPGYDPLEWLKEADNVSSDDSAETPQQRPQDAAEEIAVVAEEEMASAEAVEACAESSDNGPATEEPTDEEHSVNVSEEPVQATAEESLANEAANETDDNAPLLLDLEGSLQIMDVTALQSRMQEALHKLKKITLRADNQIMVDAAGMQLLLAFVQQAQKEAIELQWEALPPPIAEAARLLDAEQLLLQG